MPPICIHTLQKPMPRECTTLTGGEHMSVLLEQILSNAPAADIRRVSFSMKWTEKSSIALPQEGQDAVRVHRKQQRKYVRPKAHEMIP